MKGDFPKARSYPDNGLRLISAKIADVFLEEMCRDPPKDVMLAKLGYFWTSTMVAYPAAGAVFGNTLEYYSKPFTYVLDTKQFANVKGIAVVFDDYRVMGDRYRRIIVPIEPSVLFDFPQENGWFPIDSASAVPSAVGISRRFLWRTQAERVGPLVRSYGHKGWAVSDIFLHHHMNEKFSIVLTSSDEQPRQKPDENNVVVFPGRGLA